MAKKSTVTCPNCGSPLYSGHDNVAGENLACMDNSDPPNGCLTAWDPVALSEDPDYGPGPWAEEAAPEVGPSVAGEEEALAAVEEAQATAPQAEPLVEEPV